MRCDEVIRELAVPTDDRDSRPLVRASGELSVLRRLGRTCRSTRSSLGGDPADGTLARDLGRRLGSAWLPRLNASPTEVEAFSPLPVASSNGSTQLKLKARSYRAVSCSVSPMELGGDRPHWPGPGRRHLDRCGLDLASSNESPRSQVADNGDSTSPRSVSTTMAP